MKTTYQNRYGDNIVFEHISDNKIRMTGYNHAWMRCAYENDYSEAYKSYKQVCDALEEPDMDLLFDDPIQNVTRALTLDEFKEEVHKDYFYNDKKLQKFARLVESDMNDIHMVDPSGGPYLSKRTDLGRYFNDGKTRKITKMEFDNASIIFTINL
jgi:hypothetical protein